MNQDFSKIGRSVSIIERLMKMYYERGLADFEIGWGQQFFLEAIYDNPGTTPQYLAQHIHVDKATITKAIKYLQQINYITVEADETDRRVKHLHITPAAVAAVHQIKKLHHRFFMDLTEGMLEEDTDKTTAYLEQIVQNLKKHIWHRMEVNSEQEKSNNCK